MLEDIYTIKRGDIHANLQSGNGCKVVYMLFYNNSIVYIGETTRFYDRMTEHAHKNYDKVLFFKMHDGDDALYYMHKLEKGLIKFINPTYNIKNCKKYK